MHELEELLSEHLATRVRVQEGRAGGKVVLEFADLDDLERLYRRMTEPPAEGAAGIVDPDPEV
jgi:ParB family chromosome partitioning protein